MKVVSKKGFMLPYMGTERFKELTRMGVDYERGSFFIRNLNNVESIKDALSEILSEKIAFTQTCLICGKEFLCTDCKYYDTCLTRDLPFHCICKKCSQKNDLYEQYVERGRLRIKHTH